MGNVNASRSAARPKAVEGGGWDERYVQKLLVEGKVAARGVGAVDPTSRHRHECPICFLYVSNVNATTCCQQPICTECYLQIRPPRSGNVPCPFCGRDRFCALAARCEETKAEPVFARTSSPRSLKVLPSTVEQVIKPAVVTPVAKVEDRSKLEDQMRAQLDEARRRGDSAAPAPPARQGLRDLARLDPNVSLEDLQAVLHSLPTDLERVEELMILEAIQQSLQDEERRRQSAAQNDDDDEQRLDEPARTPP